jgi:hypothetical protein|nr:MAG TPA: Pyocin activator protein PrtN [Caudoviricetes sp.]
MNDFDKLLRDMITAAVDERINSVEALEERMVKMHGEYVPPIQAAKLLNVNPKTVYAMLKDGRLQGTHEGSPLVLVRSMAAMVEDEKSLELQARRKHKYDNCAGYYVR